VPLGRLDEYGATGTDDAVGRVYGVSTLKPWQRHDATAAAACSCVPSSVQAGHVGKRVGGKVTANGPTAGRIGAERRTRSMIILY